MPSSPRRPGPLHRYTHGMTRRSLFAVGVGLCVWGSMVFGAMLLADVSGDDLPTHPTMGVMLLAFIALCAGLLFIPVLGFVLAITAGGWTFAKRAARTLALVFVLSPIVCALSFSLPFRGSDVYGLFLVAFMVFGVMFLAQGKKTARENKSKSA